MTTSRCQGLIVRQASKTLAKAFPDQANGSSPIGPDSLSVEEAQTIWLSEAIGLDGPVPIVSYVPLFMFAILFGLSMDYEVFLVSQIEEHVHAGEDNRNSVVSGLVTSARVITAAALIMVFVFGSFLLNGDPTIKQFGVGLAIAIIIDSTVVRCLLVPALMIMMGRINWWLPAWLDKALPHVSIEGAEYFAERDRAAGGQEAAGVPAVEGVES